MSRLTLRRISVFFVSGLVCCFLISGPGCADPRPVKGLWPPGPEDPSRRLLVSVDTWHGMVALPQEDGSLEEWGYAERGWYLEGRQGLLGVCRALFWPTAGVVEVVRTRQPWARRTPQPPARLWEFRVTEEGYARLIRYLRESRGGPEPVLQEPERTWYPAARDYCLCHNCHHWLAGALREAGLAVSPGWAFTAGELTRQLDAAKTFE